VREQNECNINRVYIDKDDDWTGPGFFLSVRDRGCRSPVRSDIQGIMDIFINKFFTSCFYRKFQEIRYSELF